MAEYPGKVIRGIFSEKLVGNVLAAALEDAQPNDRCVVILLNENNEPSVWCTEMDIASIALFSLAMQNWALDVWNTGTMREEE